jgi:hypothetical protein
MHPGQPWVRGPADSPASLRVWQLWDEAPVRLGQPVQEERPPGLITEVDSSPAHVSVPARGSGLRAPTVNVVAAVVLRG